jgi:NADPH2:quinone reductase
LKVVDNWPRPKIEKDDEVLIEVKAFGLNFADIIARKGQYQDAPKFPFVPGIFLFSVVFFFPFESTQFSFLSSQKGYEVAGIVVNVGPRVQKVKPGQRVFGMTNFGGYAEFAKTVEAAVAPLPDSWSFEQGAAVTITFVTAYHSIFHTGPILPGSKILIHACAGGVGQAALQLAKHLNLEVSCLLFFFFFSFFLHPLKLHKFADFRYLWIR